MNSLLITGGAGFIGSNFLRLLMKYNPSVNVIILDALTYAGSTENLKDVLEHPGIKFVHGNICDFKLVAAILEKNKISGIINFAAESHVDRSILTSDSFIQTNIVGTYTLLEAARVIWKNRQDVLFLQISTDEVFGSLSRSEPPFKVDSPYRPSSPYSASKASADHLVFAWHNTYGLPTIVTNCSNNYGPWQYPEKLIPLMILNALKGRELPVYGDGMQIRDWIHVEDHCRALIKIMEDGIAGSKYNIGGNNELTNIEVVELICYNVDKFLGYQTGTSRRNIIFVKDRPGHDRKYAIDNRKIKKELNWSPRFSLQNSITELIQWYSNNMDWVNRIISQNYMEYYELNYEKRLTI